MRGKFWTVKRRLARLFPKKYILFEGRVTPKTIALTFDDGPHPRYTEKVLNLLNKYGIKATFFLRLRCLSNRG